MLDIVLRVVIKNVHTTCGIQNKVLILRRNVFKLFEMMKLYFETSFFTQKE